ncbi:MAG TPA: hypothetical protein VEI01_18165 [Terriglobales bacterium]|nr:hypothetical protein [Terriglobales bacterium]
MHLSTTCSKTTEASFSRAVALLHSFQYELARDVFADISKRDQNCAMAYWGIGMSYYNGFANSIDLIGGRGALEKAQQIAKANPNTSTCEKGYISALAEIYREGADSSDRAQGFEHRMRALQQQYPTDTEAAVFHALALAIAAPKTDKTYANQRECGAILEPIFEKYPHHPGAAHYLIHCYDYPLLAERGLVAARAYARIAPASAHAHHMPSHIFTLLGLWDESINSNLNAVAIAASAEETSTTIEARQYRVHSMDYLEYAYLQSGRVRKANGVLSTLQSLPPVAGLTPTCDYAMAAIPARYAVELGHWREAAELEVNRTAAPFAQAVTWQAIGVGSARAHDLDRAIRSERALASIREKLSQQRELYWSDQAEVQRREVEAWIKEANRDTTDALRTMRSAAELEESMEKDVVTPGAIVPAREMLAELLLLHDQAKDSLAEYQAVLKIAPNRFNALYGAARAAEGSSNPTLARSYFKKLTEVAAGEERPELMTARAKIRE